jgi:hypothetical protein
MELDSPPFTFSEQHNRFIVVGVNTLNIHDRRYCELSFIILRWAGYEDFMQRKLVDNE